MAEEPAGASWSNETDRLHREQRAKSMEGAKVGVVRGEPLHDEDADEGADDIDEVEDWDEIEDSFFNVAGECPCTGCV